MRALITGVNGFVGKYLANCLMKEGLDVWGTKHSSLHNNDNDLFEKIVVRDLDITDKDQVIKIVKEVNPDTIYHLAAQSSVALSWKNPQLTMNVNINGTLNLLDAIKESNLSSRILLIGSSEEYGIINPKDIPIKEDHLLNPSNPYAISKVAQEMIAKQYINSYGMDIVLVRAFNHIGPGQNPIFAVADFAKRISEIEKGIIEPTLLVGNLDAIRDFTDVRDVVSAYYKLVLKGKRGEVYNVGSGRTYSIQYLLNTLLMMSTSEIAIEKDPNRMRTSDVPMVQCDNTKLCNATMWKAEYSIYDTLRDSLEYWRKLI